MLSKFIKFTFIFFYISLAAEIFLRILDPVPMLPRYVSAQSFGIRGNMPNKQYVHKTAEYEVHIKTNSKGIRSNHEISYQKNPGHRRIVLLGDSFGMGYGVNMNDMFSTRMVHYLKSKYNIETEIINLSTSGHGNAEELIVLQNEGFKYDPDLVIVAWHYTDLQDNVRSRLFELSDGKLVSNAKVYLPGVKEREFLFQFPVFQYLAGNSQVYNFVRNKLAVETKRLLHKINYKNTIKKNRAPEGKNKNPNKMYDKELTAQILNQIQKECKSRNITFMILDIPVWKSRTEFFSRFPIEYNDTYNPLNVVSPISKFLSKKGQKLYWERSNGHFTPLGCDLVGELLAEYIQLHRLLGIIPGTDTSQIAAKHSN